MTAAPGANDVRLDSDQLAAAPLQLSYSERWTFDSKRPWSLREVSR